MSQAHPGSSLASWCLRLCFGEEPEQLVVEQLPAPSLEPGCPSPNANPTTSPLCHLGQLASPLCAVKGG